jgi:hypothetical protein
VQSVPGWRALAGALLLPVYVDRAHVLLPGWTIFTK